MYDDHCGRCLDPADLMEHRGGVPSDQHRQAVSELEDADWVGVNVQDVLVADSMLAGAGRDDRLSTHGDKLACGRRLRKRP